MLDCFGGDYPSPECVNAAGEEDPTLNTTPRGDILRMTLLFGISLPPHPVCQVKIKRCLDPKMLRSSLVEGGMLLMTG